jgi:predicted tellurium resistance membrane protein TerC
MYGLALTAYRPCILFADFVIASVVKKYYVVVVLRFLFLCFVAFILCGQRDRSCFTG